MSTPTAPSGWTLETSGSGPDVVLLHGALGDLRQWQPIAHLLSGRFRAAAVSRRFHWPHAMPPDGATYTFESQTADAIAFLQSYGSPVHLVGHSYGAGVSLLAALARPQLLRTVTLIEPPFASLVSGSQGEFAGELESRRTLMTRIRSLVKEGADVRAAEALIDWVQGIEHGFRSLSHEVQEGLIVNAPTIGPMYAQAQPAVTCEQVRALRLPVLVIRGARTRPWFRSIAEAAASCIPGAELASVPGAAHMCIVENPVETAALIAAFLARH